MPPMAAGCVGIVGITGTVGPTGGVVGPRPAAGSAGIPAVPWLGGGLVITGGLLTLPAVVAGLPLMAAAIAPL